MSLSDLTSAKAVRSALAEFDRRGRDAFLEFHGFGRARNYFLVVDGRRCPSKAIAGVAHGYQFPDAGPLGCHDLHGGDRTVKPKLEELGFTVEVLGR